MHRLQSALSSRLQPIRTMNRTTLTLPLLAALLILATACSGPAATTQTSTPEPDRDIAQVDYDVEALDYPALRDVEIPEPTRVELDNGLTVYLIEDRELPTVNASVLIGGGSAYDPATHVGLAALTGQVMRTGGTESMTPDEVNQALENIGASIETQFGSTTGSAFMSTLVEHTDEVLPLFVDVLQNPAFAEEKVELAKSQQKAAISRRNDDPQQIAFREFAKLLYGEDSPYARHPEYYTIDRVTREEMVGFHERFVQPENMIVSVWGDFDTDEMVGRIERAFGSWERPANFDAPSLPQATAEREAGVHLIEKEDVTQSTILMGHLGELTRENPDYFPVIVMNEVLSGGFTSRLFKNVRTDQGLAYAVFGRYQAGYDRPQQFFAGVFSKSGSTVEAANSVLHEIERLRDEVPTDEEVNLAKDAYLNSFVFNFDTRREIVDRLMTYEYFGYPSDFLQQIKTGVEQVTPADVQRVAQKYLHPDEMDILVLGKPADFDQSVSTLGAPVDEIDITIPMTPPDESADEVSDAADGRATLLAVADALGGADAFASIDNVVETTTQTAQTPMGEMQVGVRSVVAGPNRVRVERSTPMGAMTVVVNDEGATVQTPQGTQQLPASMVGQIRSQLWQSLPYLLKHARSEELEISDLGMKEIEGEQLHALRIAPPQANSYTLYIDPETQQPLRMEYTGQTQQGPVPAVNLYSDYREVSGVMLPFKTVTLQNGEEAATSVAETITVNADLEPGVFEL